MIFLARRTSFFGVYLIQLRKMVSINQGLAMSARFVEAPFKTNCFNFCTESKCFVFIFIPIRNSLELLPTKVLQYTRAIIKIIENNFSIVVKVQDRKLIRGCRGECVISKSLSFVIIPKTKTIFGNTKDFSYIVFGNT